MNDVRIVNYTLIAALLLLIASYAMAMYNITKVDTYEANLYSVTALR